MRNKLIDRIRYNKNRSNGPDLLSWLRSVTTGGLYRVSDMHRETALKDIESQIKMMRALAKDSQIDTALSYYATDATTVNTKGQIIWATPKEEKYAEVADIINQLFVNLNVNSYARDHILELATIGNLYLPTTETYRKDTERGRMRIALDNNTVPDPDYEIVPSTIIPPEDIIHLYKEGVPCGYAYQPSDEFTSGIVKYPESAVIHFSLGGLLGNYTLDTVDKDNNPVSYDIKFARPLMDRALQPTQTLNLIEDSLVLGSLSRIIKFVNVECNSDDETEIESALQIIKDKIEQQMSLNTNTGDVETFVNPMSPNNLIYLPMINGQSPINITDLNMIESSEQDNKLLQYYMDKKLSVLGVPKEAMNFSSNEGLGGAGSVLSQRSALYANSLQRLETAYMEGWRDAINKRFTMRGLSGFVDKFDLHMNPIITTQSTIQFEKRDAALSQASTLVDMLKNLGVSDDKQYKSAISEILSEVFPQMGSESVSWNLDLNAADGGDGDAI